MSTLKFVRHCCMCGSPLQTSDQEKPGYVDPSVFARIQETDVAFCDSCWGASHYNLAPKTPVTDPGFLLMMRDAKATDALIVYVIDLFSFESAFAPDLSDVLSGLKTIVLANKVDLLPKGVSPIALKRYVSARFKVSKIDVPCAQVFLTSLASTGDISYVWDVIEKERRGHDVYVIGPTGSGKRLFVSAFLRSYENRSGSSFGYRTYPNTQLLYIKAPLDRSSGLYMAPRGFSDNSALSLLDEKTALLATPSSPIRSRKIALRKGQTLFLGGLARIDLLEGKETELVSYFGASITLRREETKKSQARFYALIAKKAVFPVSDLLTSDADFDIYDLEITERGRRDLGIQGLGWISFQGAGQVFRIYTPKGVGAYTAQAKVK